MARGWEKEDVDVPEKTVAQTPATLAAEARLSERDRQRKVQGLQLQRERFLSERTSSPHRRSALAAALVEIEEQLSQLGWTVHI
ncbi:MAG: hypothetical protein ACRYF4_02370 [Janthinobacterium lividum]